jgi:oxygen-independent coproporphyrinogen-3 oxidase
LNVHTIFFGGGTPSLLTARDLEQILNCIAASFNLSWDLEVSLEANPGTLTLPYLQDLRKLGVNRLSIGMQSAQPEALRLLERQHDYYDVIQAFTWARKAGFENVNLDLIFGLPDQTLDNWKRTLSLAVGLQADHLSLYALTLEHGTPMQRWVERGLMNEPDADLAAEMYEWAEDYLESKGYRQYEISNWAREKGPNQLMVCRHNLQYWRCLPYLGFGAGAHGYANGLRIANVLSPQGYIERLLQPPGQAASSLAAFPCTPATVSMEVIDRQTEMGEMMMLGLRLTREGVSRQVFYERFGEMPDKVFASQIKKLISDGLLEWRKDALLLTPRGRLLGNRVFREFV